jgi:hypothetical protein
MSSFADLPQHRRNGWVLRYVDRLDHDRLDQLVAELDRLVRERSPRPCQWDSGPPPIIGNVLAVYGDDGRYHLCADGIPQCTGRLRPCQEAGSYWHEYWCHWWTDGFRYRAQALPDVPSDRQQYQSRRVTWMVTLNAEAIDPGQVQTRQRCPDHHARGQWPPYDDSRTQIGRIRAALVSALGRNCHACHRRAGVDVDHDPLTLQIRGLVCKTCNNHVESCPHVSDCPWADYLNSPPATPLQLIYPRPASAYRAYRKKITALGFDPFPHSKSSAADRPGCGHLDITAYPKN